MTAASTADSTPTDGNRKRDFRLYWIAGAVDQLGSQTSGIVFPLVTLAITGSPAAAGLVGALALAGRLVAAPAAGVLADRLPRKRMMVASLLLAAATMAVLFVSVASGTATLVVLAAAAFVEGLAQSGYEAAGAGSIRRVLPADDKKALSRLEARNHAVQIVGPVFGGALYQIGRWVPFLVDAVSYVVSAFLVSAIRTDLTPDRAERTSFLTDLRDGLRFVWRQPFLRFVTIWAAGINFTFGALIYYAILTAGQQGAAAASIGLVLTVASVGGLTGALLAPAVFSRVRPMTVIVVASWAMVALVAAMSQARQTWTYGLLFGLVFLLSPLLGVIFQSRVIALTPDELQGRVGTVMGTAGEVLQTPAPLLAGLLVAWYSPTAVALIFAAALAGLAVYTTVNLRQLRAGAEDPPDDAMTTEPGATATESEATPTEPVAEEARR
ncbi:putative MFS family arabinose efflux permease [Micromonospora sp. Llam0]|uniref:MFS transporter n=1 Tax=Micromonospora sp. Llam0 TaxID=2485143 RepID=UPI000FC2AF5E|nr:MFS transporter [Micromonospora sp. Llam0]ROO52453.1 putative MFS family arabinose efflux permease [Micromonospora sp. Llam0]